MSGRNYGYGGSYSSNYDRDRGGGGGRDRDRDRQRGYQPYGNRGEYNRDRGGGGRGDDRYGGSNRGLPSSSGFSRGESNYPRRENFYSRFQNNSAESRGYGGAWCSSGPRTRDSYGGPPSSTSSAAAAIKAENIMPTIPKDIEEKVMQAVSDVKMEGIFDKIRNQCLNNSATTKSYMNIEDKIVSKTDEYLKRVPWTKHLQQRIVRDRLKSYLMETKFFKDCMDRLVQDSLSEMAKDSVRPMFTKAIEQFLGFERKKKSAEETTTSGWLENTTNMDEEKSETPSSSVQMQFPPLPPIQPPPPPSEPPLLFSSKILREYDHDIGADKEKNLFDHYAFEKQQSLLVTKEENQVPLISSSEKNESVDCISLPIDMEISDYEDNDVEESHVNAIKGNEIDDHNIIKLNQEKIKDENYNVDDDDDDDDVNITPPPYSPIEYDIQEKEEEISEEEQVVQVKQEEVNEKEDIPEKVEIIKEQEMQEKEEEIQQQQQKIMEGQEDPIIDPIYYLDPLPLLKSKLKFFARFKKNDSFGQYNVRNISFEDEEGC